MLGHENDEKIRFSVSGLIRHDESCCDLYRHAVGNYDSSNFSSLYLMPVELSFISLSGKSCSGLAKCNMNFYV
jgi:hypothetical protein